VNFGLFASRSGIELTNTHSLYSQATTVTYATIAFCQFINILSRRYTYESFFSKTLFTNSKILISIAISLGLIIAVIYVPFFSSFIGFGPLNVMDWVYVVGASVVFLMAHETVKFFKRQRRQGDVKT